MCSVPAEFVNSLVHVFQLLSLKNKVWNLLRCDTPAVTVQFFLDDEVYSKTHFIFVIN